MSEFTFSHEERDNGGIKYPKRVILRAHHPDGSVAGELNYFPPKRKKAPVTVDTISPAWQRARGAASALLGEVENRHPGSRMIYMDELHEKNKPKPGDPGFNPNREYGLPTDWDTHYPALPESIHRGLGVRLSPQDAETIHNPQVPSHEQAKIIRRAIETGGPGGMHWSADATKSEQFAHRNVIDPRTDIPVIMHAVRPDRKEIETRPDVLRNKGVWPHDHSSGDAEVPIRKRRPVEITGISWMPDVDHPEADEEGWVHHTFGEPLRHYAQVSQSLTPRNLGGYHGEEAGRARGGRYAGRGKPRANGQPRGSGDDPGGAQPDAGAGVGGLGGPQEGPRPVTLHPGAAKDLKALDRPEQKKIMQVIDSLANDEPGLQTHPLTGPLQGWHSTKASRGHRIVHRPTGDGGIHVGYIGLHDYDKAIRRLTSRERHSNDLALAWSQQEARKDHPELTEPLPSTEFAASGRLQDLLGQLGHPDAERAFVMEHEDPTRGASQVVTDEDDAPGVALHPARWDQGTLAHEAAHIMHAHADGRHLLNRLDREHHHGPEFAEHYRQALATFAPEASDRFMNRYNLARRMLRSNPNWLQRKAALVPINSREEYNDFIERHYGPDAGESGRRAPHPRSGHMVQVGEHRHLSKPPEGEREGPAYWNIDDHGELPNLPLFPQRKIRQDPLEHVYRGVSQEEWKQAQERGYLKSDQRGTIADWEGTNAATDPRTAMYYLPNNGSGHVLKIRVHPEDKWFVSRPDDYVRTREKIPIDRVEHVSPLIHKDKMGTTRGYEAVRKRAVDDEIDTSYHMLHRPPDREDGIPLHDLTNPGGEISLPEDIYTRPHQYNHAHEANFWEAIAAIQKARGKPEAKIRIYRALPADHAHHGFQPGDWVTTSQSYARQHSESQSGHLGPEHHWPVISTVVKADDLHTDGDDLREWGYNGPHHPWAQVSFKGGYHQEVRQHADGIVRPVKRRKPKEGAARPRPKDRIFGPTYGLDHRLFDGMRLKPIVRQTIMDRLDQVLRVDSGLTGSDWTSYIEVYLGGSEASEWTGPNLEGNNDFDTLLGINYDELRAHDGRGASAEWIDKTDSEIDEVFNDVLRTFFNDDHWAPPWGGVWSLTGFVNEDAFDIRDIKPYAAYDISKDRWAVKPPHLPDWGPDSFPEGPALWKEIEAVQDYIEAIESLPEPFRAQQGAALYDHLHNDRHRAFGPDGEGWYDPGNVLEKALDQSGHWARLLKIKKDHDAGNHLQIGKTAVWDPSRHPAEHLEDLEHFRDEWENSSHTSRALTGASAKIMGIPGYEHTDEDDWLGSPDDRLRLAHRALRLIHHDPGSPEPLFHGAKSSRYADAQPGDEIRLPLKSTSGARSVAQAFASDHGHPGTVLEFPKGTPHFEQPGLDAENWAHSEEKYSIGEGVVAGHFRVAHRGKDEEGHTHLRLEPLGTYDPDRDEWVSRSGRIARKTAANQPFPNPYHGDEDRKGRNPEWSHTWFHGLRTENPDLNGKWEIREEDRPGRGRGGPQMNKLLGRHFSPLHDVAHGFARHTTERNALVHAELNFKNPAHFADEAHLDRAIFRWARDNWPGFHNEEMNDRQAWNGAHTSHTLSELEAKKPTGDPDKDLSHEYRVRSAIGNFLQWHPDQPEIARGFIKHLHDAGHYGITYGNVVEGPHYHVSAIATDPSQIKTTHVEYIAPRSAGEQFMGQEIPAQKAHEVTHEKSAELNESQDFLDKIEKENIAPAKSRWESRIPAPRRPEYRYQAAKTAKLDLPPEQEDAFEEPSFIIHRRKMLQVAKNPPVGTHIWRGETRPKHLSPQEAAQQGVGMHWTVNPDAILHPWPEEGHHNVIWHGVIEDPEEQTLDRSHPIWHGRHYSEDSEAEVRLRHGTQIKLKGAYVWHPEDQYDGAGTFVPRFPERTSPKWSYHPLDVHSEVTHRPIHDDVIDYSGIEGFGKTSVLPGDDTSDMDMGSKVEWVRTDALMPHREFKHHKGWSENYEGRVFGPRHSGESWDRVRTSHPDNVSKTADLEHPASTYVKNYFKSLHDRDPDEMEEEDIAPQALRDDMDRNGDKFDFYWDRQSDLHREHFRKNLNKLSQKKLIIGTSNAREILHMGRMKTISELGPDKHWGGTHYFGDRLKYERHVMGIEHGHDSIPKDWHPIYGAVMVHPAHSSYGDHQFELKPEVRKRATVTMGDSLNETLRNYPLEDVPHLSHEQIRAMTDPFEVDRLSQGRKPGSYMEFQIHGGVHLNDIAKLHVHGSLSSRDHELIEHAKSKGLEVVHHPRDQFQQAVDAENQAHHLYARMMNGKNHIKLDVGRGGYALYRRGMKSKDKISIVRPEGVTETTWGALVALSNGEILQQLPREDEEGPQKTADYRMQHKPPTPDADHKTLDHYDGGDPDEHVRIYRAVPHHVRDIEPNTWISLNPSYTHDHAVQYDGSPDWPVLTATVPKKHVYWDENDENEHGYHGPTIPEADVHDEETDSVIPRDAYDADRESKGLNENPESHMGTAVHLPPEVHRIVHDESRPVRERAELLFKHLPEKAKAGRGSWNDDNIDASFDAEDAAEKLPQEPHRPTQVILHSPDRWEGHSGISWHPDYLHDEPNRYVDVDDDWHHHSFGGFRHEAQTRRVPTNGGQGDISDSMMVAIVPPADVAEALALDDEAGLRAEELHITLLYLGKASSFTDKQLSQLPTLIQQWAKTQEPVTAKTQGAGTFVNEGNHCMWASVDIPGGTRMHDSLVDFLQGHGIPIKETHGFIPHITLKYEKWHIRFMPKIRPETWTVDEIWWCRAGEWVSYPLGR